MTHPKVVAATVGLLGPIAPLSEIPAVRVTLDDGTQKTLFQFYPDEISFTEQELIGLTEAEVRTLRHTKDVAYLRS